MHIADASVGVLGASGIVAGGLPLAVGAGLAARLRRNNRVAAAFFGDGASSQGVVHEAMNLAAVWRTATIFVCENNGYAVSTPASSAVAGESIAFRALGYGFDGCIVDGQNVIEMVAVAIAAVSRLRDEPRPFLLEAKTYRYREHAEGVSLQYRPQSEIDEWVSQRDPIDTFAQRAVEMGALTPLQVDEVDAEVRDLISEAVSFAEKSPSPDPSHLYEFLYG